MVTYPRHAQSMRTAHTKCHQPTNTAEAVRVLKTAGNIHGKISSTGLWWCRRVCSRGHIKSTALYCELYSVTILSSIASSPTGRKMISQLLETESFSPLRLLWSRWQSCYPATVSQFGFSNTQHQITPLRLRTEECVEYQNVGSPRSQNFWHPMRCRHVSCISFHTISSETRSCRGGSAAWQHRTTANVLTRLLPMGTRLNLSGTDYYRKKEENGTHSYWLHLKKKEEKKGKGSEMYVMILNVETSVSVNVNENIACFTSNGKHTGDF